MSEKWACPECGETNDMSITRCTCGNEATVDEDEVEEKDNRETSQITNSWPKLIIISIAVLMTTGFLRIYYGGGIGLKIVTKHSLSFKDTIVNLDDLLGKPRILVASEHPAVKRQLEEMGVLETDEQVQKRIEQEIEMKSKQIMQDYEKEMKRMQRQLGY